MKKRIVRKLAAFALAGIALCSYGETINESLTVNGGISINTFAVPLTFSETDQTGVGSLWRMPLDSGKLRFDASEDGVDFSSFKTVLSLLSSGNVGIGTTGPTELLHLKSYGPSRIKIEADLDNSNEWDNAQMLFSQDGGNVSGFVGFGDNSNKFQIRNDFSDHLSFFTAGAQRMTIDYNGLVGIGTSSPQNKLDVAGTIRAEEVIVETGWADYVFEPGYQLRPLSEVELHINEHGHLPGVPSGKDVVANGLSLGESQAMMMAKIEELTLYVLQQQKQISSLKAELEQFRTNSQLK